MFRPLLLIQGYRLVRKWKTHIGFTISHYRNSICHHFAGKSKKHPTLITLPSEDPLNFLVKLNNNWCTELLFSDNRVILASSVLSQTTTDNRRTLHCNGRLKRSVTPGSHRRHRQDSLVLSVSAVWTRRYATFGQGPQRTSWERVSHEAVKYQSVMHALTAHSVLVKI